MKDIAANSFTLLPVQIRRFHYLKDFTRFIDIIVFLHTVRYSCGEKAIRHKGDVLTQFSFDS